MADDDIQLALAGSGLIAGVHAEAVRHVPGLRVTRVASRDPARAAATAQRIKAEPCTYDDLPAGAAGVVVATPPAQHLPHTLQALAGGAGVLVEKPLCVTLAEADELVAAEEAGACIAYAENLLHAPMMRLALAQAAELSGIALIEVRSLQSRPTWGDFLTEGWGGGALFDLGVHPLALALQLALPAVPVEISATLDGAEDIPVDEHAEVQIRFDTRAVATVIARWRGTGTLAWDGQVASPDGVVRFELQPALLLERNGAEVRLPGIPAGVPTSLEELGYLPQMESFALDLQQGRRPELGAAYGRHLLDVVCAAYASAGQGGAWLPLPFEGPRDRTPLQLWRG